LLPDSLQEDYSPEVGLATGTVTRRLAPPRFGRLHGQVWKPPSNGLCPKLSSLVQSTRLEQIKLMGSTGKTYSITLRLRKTTFEDGYVSVPLTSAITKLGDDGTTRIDTDAFLREAMRLSEDPRVEWRVENVTTEGHPMQQPRPDDRTTFDPYDLKPDAIH